MTKQRRVFTNYPESLQTPQNNRETFIADDPLFEPEQASFLNGFIGDTSVLTVQDLERTPPIIESDAERQKYQLSVGANYINPASQERESAAFYTDMVRQIAANGGYVDDPNRVFATNFYAWTPPIDYDKHINFSRYLWTGDGAADVQGEYITKEPSHSKTIIHIWNGTTVEPQDVTIVNGLPAPTAVGDIVEDASTIERFIYRSNGVAWVPLNIVVSSDIPTTFTGLLAPVYFYVARTGPDFNRPLVWTYSADAGRWIAHPVVVSPVVPDVARPNMVWEDSRNGSERILKIFQNGTFVDLAYTPAPGPTGAPGVDGEYIYDTRNYADLTDEWARENWWRHSEDLSPVDLSSRGVEDNGRRPILEFWNGIESVAGDTKDYRNDSPVYKKYAIAPIPTTGAVVDTGESTTIFQYATGNGPQDAVLGFPLSFNDTGEIQFTLTLESDASAFIGYHHFKDLHTGTIHGIWFKSDTETHQDVDAAGLYDVPVGIASNPDHEILTTASRSRMLRHMTGVIGAQEDFQGSLTGLNGFRWSKKNPAVGSTIIDSEQTHLRMLATLQSTDMDIPNAIRAMAKEYNKTLFRFTNRMNQLWNDLSLTNGNGSLLVTPAEAVDAVLTSLFIGRNDSFPFYYSDMGTFIETLVVSGVPTVVDPTPKPIFIAPSPPRVGASPTYTPETFVERNGDTVLRGHEGMVIPSFDDERDLIWLELQNRFYEATPESYRTETDTQTARFDESQFFMTDYYGNLQPQTSNEPVDSVVPEFNAIVAPADGLRVFSTGTGVFALYSAGQWLVRDGVPDEVFLNNADGEYYIFNGITTAIIERWNRPFAFDYTIDEFRTLIRRDFERFIIFREEDFSQNVTFVQSDPFTWNYSSAGVEGHYLGIYQRVYNTTRPHSHPWEVMGYFIEPDWWRTQYVPDSTSADGTPRYGSAHSMWTDFAVGTVDHPAGPITKSQFVMAAPTPVDASGELLNPIDAGVVNQSSLDMGRIDDIWVYGDGAPMEQEFLNSSYYSFSVSLAGYLMKNGRWVDSLWSELYIGVGDIGTDQLFRSPHIVQSTTLTRPAVSTLPVHLETDSSGNVIQRIGINAWISEFISINGGSPTNDFGVILRNTSPALGWKTSGYIVRNRTIVSTLSRKEIPFSDVHVLLNKSQTIESNFCSGVLITRESNGYRVFGYDPFDPFFTVERPNIPIAGGQVLLTEEFTVDYVITDPQEQQALNITGGSVLPNTTLQRTFVVTEFKLPRVNTGTGADDTAQLAVIVNGMRFKDQHITVNNKANSITIEDIVAIELGDRVEVQVLTTQSAPNTQMRQFIVDGVAFPYFSGGTGEFERIEYGRFFETSTDVINFMLGYGRYLEQQGWIFDDVVGATGTSRDWFLGARRFATWVLRNESPWGGTREETINVLDRDTFYYSPILNNANFVSEFGQTVNVESIMNGAFGILNRSSRPIDTDSTVVNRTDNILNIKRLVLTDEESEIYGARVNLIEAEHVVMFSNTTRFNDVIYDPVSGLAQGTLVVDTYRTLNWQGRLEANGFIINGGTLLPNFEKQAFDFTRFYDRYNPPDDTLRRSQARNLYGFVPANQSRRGSAKSVSLRERTTSDSSQYMIPIGTADRSRFDYYRGMIQTKGTVRPIYAYTRGTTIGRDNFFLNEDWAWKLQQFGDTRREITQIRVEKDDFADEVQVIQFGGPVIVSNNTIEIPDFNRNDLDSNTRWILPPEKCDLDDVCNQKFPLSRFNSEPPTPEKTFMEFLPVTGLTLSTGGNGDYFDISSPTETYRVWFDVRAEELTYVDVLSADNPTYNRQSLIAGQTELLFDGVDNNGTFQGGSEYAVGDEVTLSDGSVISITSVGGEVVLGFTITTTGGNAYTGVALTQVSVNPNRQLRISQTQIDYDDVGDNGTFFAGTGHTVGDIITLSDGTTITVDAEVAGEVTEFTVSSVAPELLSGTGTLNQTSTTGSGIDFNLNFDRNNVRKPSGFVITPNADNLVNRPGSTWTLSEATSDVEIPHHVWYSVEDSEGFTASFNGISGDLFSSSGPGDYFTIGEAGSPATSYHVWFNVGSNNTDPAPGGSAGGIEVMLTGDDTDNEVANAVALALNDFLGGTVFSASNPQPPDDVVVVTHLLDGIAVDPVGVTIPSTFLLPQTHTTYNGVGGNGTYTVGDGAGGTAYAELDTITLSDGSVVRVDVVDGNGDVRGFTIISSSLVNVVVGAVLSQVSSTGTGTGFSITPQINNVLGVLFTVSTSGVGPNTDPLTTPNGHKVIVSPTDSAEIVAQKTAEILASIPAFSGTLFNGNTVVLINSYPGDVTNAADVDAGVTITVQKEGDNPNTSPPSSNNTLVQIMVNTTSTSLEIANAVVAALQAVDTEFQLPKVNNENGTSTNITISLVYPLQANVLLGVFPTPPVVSVAPAQNGRALIDVDNYRYFAKLFDTTTNLTVLDHIHFDPDVDRFDPDARCLIDYETPLDPARYNNGPEAAFSDDRCWGAGQVGCLWWNKDRSQFVDYRGLTPDYEDLATVWGEPLYYKASITREDDVVTVTTYDFVDFNRTTPVSHGVSIGDSIIVSIRQADQVEYDLTNLTVTAINTTQFQFEIETNPDTPGTGDIELVVGHIDIYEWVSSPVEPQDWVSYVAGLNDPTHPNGIPLNSDDPSYVELVTKSSTNQNVTTYYFWVLNSTAPNNKDAIPQESRPGKKYTAAQISSRMSNPTINGIPWFAPVDATHMLIYTDGEKVQNGYGIEILIDQRFLQTHDAFVLVSEKNRFFNVPSQIIEKVLDSMAQIDAKGNTVPSPLLSDTEKFGSCFFPIQTVYASPADAVDVYVSTLNGILEGKNLRDVDLLTGIFKLSDEYNETTNPGGYWVRAQYVIPEAQDLEIYDTVPTIAERDRRASIGFYADKDVVRVLSTNNIDAWTGDPVATNYQYNGTTFLEVAIDNNTAAINSNIVIDQERFRGIPDRSTGLFTLIYDVLEKLEQNDLMFSLLYQMKVQHADPRCTWFFKTSYITTQVFTTTDKSPFVRPDEVTAIRDNLLDVKAFRTKLRGDTNTVTISEIEPFDTNLLEFPDKKVTLVYDRLACDASDECGWDIPAWDSRQLPCSTWDTPLWEFEDFGRGEFYILSTIVGDGGTFQYTVPAIFDPTLYTVRIRVFQNGEEIDTPLGFIVTFDHKNVYINTGFTLGPSFTIQVEQSQGFYEGAIPSFIGTTMEGTLFEPAPSSAEHAIIRSPVPYPETVTVVGGDGNTFTTTSGPYIEIYLNGVLQLEEVDYIRTFDYANSQFSVTFNVAPVPGDVVKFVFMRGCLGDNDELGGRPEERIVNEVCDSVNICVINDHTPAYNGWDTTPWDIAPWDIQPVDVGRRVFIMSVGKQTDIPAGPEFFNTSETIAVTDPLNIIGSEPQSNVIEVFELQKGGVGAYVPMTLGVEFEMIGIFNNMIRTKVPEQQDFIADGVNTVFVTTAGTEIARVYLQGVLQTEGVDYTLDPGRTVITWIQPAPLVFPNNAFMQGQYNVGDGSNVDFETGHLADGLDAKNIFAFVNGDLQPISAYITQSGVSDVQFLVAPPATDPVITWALGNTFADQTNAFAVREFVASAAQTIFSTAPSTNTTSARTFVFVDGRYQVEGVDYNITAIDEVTFTSPMVGGEAVDIRFIFKGVIDVDHIQFTTSGGATDVIPGLFDAEDIENVLIFLGDTVQDGWSGTPDYTITDTNPDTINWAVTPAGGLNISVRIIRTIQMSTTVVIDVNPNPGQTVSAQFVPYIEPGDNVRYRFNGWHIGPLGGYTVGPINPPLDTLGYDIVQGVLSFDSLPAQNQFFGVNYTKPRPGPSPESILVRMPEIAADILDDHTSYDPPNGFNGYRPVGTRIVNSTTNHVFSWDGANWIDGGIPAAATQFYITRTQEIWEYNGAMFVLLFSVGDAFTKPPLLDFPAFGAGITFGTYAFGTSLNAAVEYEDAFQVMQHPGDCPK